MKKKGYFALLVFVITITIPLFTTFSRSPEIVIVDGYQVSFCDQEPGEWQETNPPPLDLSDYIPSVMTQPYDNWPCYESQAYEQLINEPPAYDPQIAEHALNNPPEYSLPDEGPPPGRTINDYLLHGRSIYNVLFDVEFLRVDGNSLVPVISQTYGNGESAFAVWAALNNKHNIELICHFMFMTSEMAFHPCGQITGGGFRRVELTLSSDILNYLQDEDGLLVIESLAKSFINMWRPVDGIIDIELIVYGAAIYSRSVYFHLHS